MNPEQITKLVTEAGQLLCEHYVFPEVGNQIAKLITDRLAAGDYAAATTPQSLGEMVTRDLQSLNGDKHLRLKHHEHEIPDLPSEAMMQAQWQREAAGNLSGIAKLERLDGNIALLELGPILYSAPIAGAAIIAAMNIVASADALILDLRGNVGGDPHTVALVCSFLFDGPPTHVNDMYERADERITQFWTLPYVPGPRFGGSKPIWVLTSGKTFSGGEELAYDLQQLDRATLAGERTGGGAHPRVGIRLHPHLELAVPTARAANPLTGTNWEGVGVVPDIEVPAAAALDTAIAALSTLVRSAA